MMSEAEYNLFVIQQDIRDLIFQVVNRINDQEDEEVITCYTLKDLDRYLNLNPLYYRTKQGLFLEYSDGKPQTIWSPMGSWSLGFVWLSGPEAIVKFNNMLTGYLDLELFQELQHDACIGSFGPIYAINQMEGSVDIPKPIYGDSKPTFKIHETSRLNSLDFGYSLRVWREMTKRYLWETGSGLSSKV